MSKPITSISMTKAEETTFWDSAWSSEKLTKGTEMIDRYIPKSSVEFSYSLLGDITGKKLLEIGCGSGYETVEFCQKGAFVIAIDLSTESVKAAKERCKKNNIKRVRIEKMNAESLRFKDNTFDRVYINKVLLHTDKEKVLAECIRVLKKDGILVINEMLKHWLFTFPYRTFSPYRKSNPKYITLKDINKLNMGHKEFYLFSTFFLFLFYIPVLSTSKFAYTLFTRIARLDTLLLKMFPSLRNFAWITVAWLRK